MNILIVGPAWVGDMVMTQSLFKIIKKINEQAVIDVLAPDWSRPLLERMPEVRHAHVMPIGHGRVALKERYQIAQNLKLYGYDQAILIPNSWKSGLIPWLADIPVRTGFWGEFRLGLLNDGRILNKKKWLKMVDRLVSLAYPKETLTLPAAPIPHLVINPVSRDAAIIKFKLQETVTRPILALCPGAEFGASKRWPEKYYAEVALAKQKEGWSVWIFGSKNDQAVARQIQEKTNHECVDLTGKTSLAEAIDLLSLATMVVSNDSGLMHVAAALQKSVVAVYGSTDPGYTPPLGEGSKVVRLSLPCSPCFKRECPLKHHRCMEDLKPGLVLNELNGMVS